ncbi:MAG: TolC family protein, partial [Tsuneonella troitsensis]
MRKYTLSIATAVLLASASTAALAQDSGPVTLQEAVSVAMKSNPEIIQAQMNTEAIQAERKQAQGLYAPRVDLEASAGVRRLENTTRRNLGIADQELYPLEVGGVLDWT